MCKCSCGRTLVCKCPNCGKIHGETIAELDRHVMIEHELYSLFKAGTPLPEATAMVLGKKRSDNEPY